MTGYQQPMDPRPRITVNAGRLWAGGAATAIVAALIAIVGVLIGRGLFDVQVLAPKSGGVWGDASTGWYALGAAFASLVATGLVHMLLLTTPRPMRFFGWVIALATLAGMAAPFVTEEELGAQVYTSTLNMILGIAIGSLVAGTARSAIVRTARRPAPRPSPGPYG